MPCDAGTSRCGLVAEPERGDTQCVVVLDRDELARRAAQAVAWTLCVGGLTLLGAHAPIDVVECPARALRCRGRLHDGSRQQGALVVYVLQDRLLAGLHVLHHCADAVAVLWPSPAGDVLEVLEDAGPLGGLDLTEREVDVLALLLARATNAEIAGRLVVSEATVRAHCRAILRKTECGSRGELGHTLASKFAQGSALVGRWPIGG